MTKTNRGRPKKEENSQKGEDSSPNNLKFQMNELLKLLGNFGKSFEIKDNDITS